MCQSQIFAPDREAEFDVYIFQFFYSPAPPSSQLTVLKKLERKTCRTNGAFNQGALIIPNNGPMIDWRRLEKMLDANDPGKLIY